MTKIPGIEIGETPENNDDPAVVRIFDTTLRDGEQAPGASLTPAEKLELARHLARLRVDVMEAGFPAASQGDFDAVRQIAEEVGTPDGPMIAGLARTTESDIERCFRALETAAKPRIHTFIATSDLHMERKLKMKPEQVLWAIDRAVRQARSLCADVEFSAEDASRSDPAFLVEALAVAIAAGATTLNVPDTVGYAMPAEYGELIARLIAETPGAARVTWSVHCHDDLGCATANSLAGLLAGARQVEVTVNGIGERAGNASLEEIVMALHTRAEILGLSTQIDTEQILRTSQMVRNYTNMPVPPNKAVVGDNAFAHEAGIHQHGVLCDAMTYEIMTPKTIGLQRSRLVLGKHSGRHAFEARLRELGHHLETEALDEVFRRFKELADRKKSVADADLDALVSEQLPDVAATWSLVDLQVACGRPGLSTATARLRAEDGSEQIAAAVAAGPIHAAFRAIDLIVQEDVELIEYQSHGITEGVDALGGVSVRVRRKQDDAESIVGGFGTDTDILRASTAAYLTAVNRLLAIRVRSSVPMARPTAKAA